MRLKTDWQNRWLKLQKTHDQIQELATTCQKFAVDFRDNRKGKRHFIVCGGSGTGKTHSAENMYNWFQISSVQLWRREHWKNAPTSEWFEFAQIAFLPMEEFRRWLDDRNKTDLLFLEDIGAEVDRFRSGEPTERLREILNEFKNRWLFITTNIMPEHWETKWDNRIADRLMRDSTVVTLRNAPRFTMKTGS